MRLLQPLTQALKLVLFLVITSPVPARGNKDRRDICGLSVHTSDISDIGDFAAIEGTLTVPKVAPSNIVSATVYPGVALCCGDDCSVRLSAGVKAWSLSGRDMETSEAAGYFSLTPTFGSVRLPQKHNFMLNASDTVWTRVEIKSPTTAELTFAKFQGPASNLTVSVGLTIGTENGRSVLSIITRSNGVTVNMSYHAELGKPEPAGSLCGDSAWWFVSDASGPGEDPDRAPSLPYFSPVLFGNHRLQTTQNKQFPTRLALSGMSRSWNMVKETEGETEVLCHARGFVDSGMTLMHAPHSWGV